MAFYQRTMISQIDRVVILKKIKWMEMEIKYLNGIKMLDRSQFHWKRSFFFSSSFIHYGSMNFVCNWLIALHEVLMWHTLPHDAC